MAFLLFVVIGYITSTYFFPSLWVKGGVLDVFPSRFLTGKVEKFWFKSEITPNRRVWVYLPPGYEDQNQQYPVMYVHDGQWAFDGRNGSTFGMEFSLDETLEKGIASGTIPPVIVVGIQSFLTGEHHRSYEFLPLPYQDGDLEIGGGAVQYTAMLLDELMPYINRRYKTLTGPENTTSIGFGHGANLSYYLAFNHYDQFGSIIAHSPDMFYKQQWMKSTAEALPEKLPVRVWTDIGSAELPIDFQMDFQFNTFVAALRQKGWASESDFSSFVEPGGLHTVSAVARRFPLAMNWLFNSSTVGLSNEN